MEACRADGVGGDSGVGVITDSQSQAYSSHRGISVIGLFVCESVNVVKCVVVADMTQTNLEAY